MEQRQTASRRIADWACSLYRSGIADSVADKFKPHVLDALGCAIGACRKGVATEAATIAERTADPLFASIISRRGNFSAEVAAFANGALIHALDFDDTHSLSVTHATAATLPAALAVGESNSNSGHQIITATIAGIEVICRLGAAARNQFHLRGFHPSSVCGVFGAATAAALLLRGDEPAVLNSLGLAGSFASGLFAYLQGSSNPKPFHLGHAARDGVVAARLAMAGATGPDTVIEGRYGLFDSFVGARSTALDEQLRTLGVVWECTRLSIKPYPACHSMHACLDAAAILQAKWRFEAKDVAAIVAIVPGDREVSLVLEPQSVKRRPTSPTVARFSLPYSVAHLIVRGRVDIDAADQENLNDPTVLALADMVTYRVGTFPTSNAAMPGAIEIRLKSGDLLSHIVAVERGGPDNPSDQSDIIDKYRSNVGNALSTSDRDHLSTAVLSLNHLREIRVLTSLLRKVVISQPGGGKYPQPVHT